MYFISVVCMLRPFALVFTAQTYCACCLLHFLVRCQAAFRCRRVMTVKRSLIKVQSVFTGGAGISLSYRRCRSTVAEKANAVRRQDVLFFKKKIKTRPSIPDKTGRMKMSKRRNGKKGDACPRTVDRRASSLVM